MPEKSPWFGRWRWPVALLIFLTAVYLFYYLAGPAMLAMAGWLLRLVAPFILGLIFASLLDPLVNLIVTKGRFPRWLGVLLTMTTVFGGLGLVVFSLLYSLITELRILGSYLPTYNHLIKDIIGKGLGSFGGWWNSGIPDELQGTLDELISRGSQYLTTLTSGVVDWFISIITGVPDFIIIVVFGLISTYFFIADKVRVRAAVYRLFPSSWENKLDTLGREVGAALLGFIWSQVILALISITITFVGLSILKVNFALTLSVLVGLFDILPILGPGTLFIPWAIWEIISESWGMAFSILVLYGIVTLVRQVIQPKVIGWTIGLHALEALAAIYFGLRILGIWGLILGPVLWVAVKATLRSGIFTGTRKIK